MCGIPANYDLGQPLFTVCADTPYNFMSTHHLCCPSQWPRGLMRRSAAASLLRLWVRIPPRAWMFVCCVLSGRGLCHKLITRPEEYCRMWCVVVCDLEISWMRRLWFNGSCRAKNKQTPFILRSSERWKYWHSYSINLRLKLSSKTERG